MFQKGEKVLYGQTGVCIVEDICEKEMTRGDKKLYYVLKPIYQHNNSIFLPVDNDSVFMRKLITKEEANELLKQIPLLKERADTAVFEKPNDYKAYFETHSCSDLAELAIKIHIKKQKAKSCKRKLGFIDEKYLMRAEELLFGELAVVLEKDIEEIPKMLFESFM